MISYRSHPRTPEIDAILSVHHQLWDHADTITYKEQTAFSYQPSHRGYRSVILNNAKGVPHLWVTQNMHKTTYGSYAITRADQAGERLRITWIVYTANGEYRYVGQVQTHEYFHDHKQDRIHIETYAGDTVNIVYTTHQAYAKDSPYS